MKSIFLGLVPKDLPGMGLTYHIDHLDFPYKNKKSYKKFIVCL